MKDKKELNEVTELNAVYILYNLAIKHVIDRYSNEQSNKKLKNETIELVNHCFHLLKDFVKEHKGEQK